MNLHRPTQRVIDILLQLSENEDGLTLTEISQLTDIPKSTISPILRTLENFKFTTLNSQNKYIIGSNAFKVGGAFLKSNSGIDIIRSYMEEIVDKCNEVCQLGVYNNREVLFLEKIEPSRSIKLVSNIGVTLPAHATALGKCLLTQFTNDEIREIFKDGLTSLTKNTINDVEELIEELEKVRKNGYAYECGEVSEEIKCMAIPLKVRGQIVAALSVAVPFFRKSENKFSEIINLLLEYRPIIEANIYNAPLDLN